MMGRLTYQEEEEEELVEGLSHQTAYSVPGGSVSGTENMQCNIIRAASIGVQSVTVLLPG